jgi:hypothetical protein
MEPVGIGATWTGSPKGVFAERKHHKPRLSLKNNAAGVRKREDARRTREAGNRDEVEGVVANTLNLFPNGAVGFIDWLDRSRLDHQALWIEPPLRRRNVAASQCSRPDNYRSDTVASFDNHSDLHWNSFWRSNSRTREHPKFNCGTLASDFIRVKQSLAASLAGAKSVGDVSDE